MKTCFQENDSFLTGDDAVPPVAAAGEAAEKTAGSPQREEECTEEVTGLLLDMPL